MIFLLVLFFLIVMPPFVVLEAIEPDWCKHLPRPAYKNLERVSIPDNWFEVYHVQPGVYAIYEPRQYEEVISFLITGSKRALLVDTGMGIGNLQKVIEELTKLPVSVLNTHSHPDHIGSNYQFQSISAVDS
ncbi:MAG: MBL fold metallo-hydrolase, partial [Anaerolineae bacterium]|nr:MBL fold metallo-hydrolase [Anaerolineae bacterium]